MVPVLDAPDGRTSREFIALFAFGGRPVIGYPDDTAADSERAVMIATPDAACPCGTGETFDVCCGPALQGRALPQTAQALMRSRYTAFVLDDTEYLAASWHSSTRPEDASAPAGVSWRRLRIRDTVAGGPADATGEVEFIAHFRTPDGTRNFLHERSRFVRENQRWVYVDGELF